MIDELLSDALRARVADVRPDPDSRDAIAARLVEHGGHRPRWTLVAVAAAVLVVAAAAALVAVARPGHDSPPADRLGLPGYLLPASEYVIGTPAAGEPDDTRRRVIVRVSDGVTVGALPIGQPPLTDPVLSPDGRFIYGLRDAGRSGQREVALDTRSGDEHGLGTYPTFSGRVGSLTIGADGTELGAIFVSLVKGVHTSSVTTDAVGTGHNSMSADLEGPLGRQVGQEDSAQLALNPDGSAAVLDDVDGSALYYYPFAADMPTPPSPGPFASGRPKQLSAGHCAGTSPPRLVAPQWTRDGLFALRLCNGAKGVYTSVDVVRVDPVSGRLTVLHRLSTPGTTAPTVRLVAAGGPRFVIGVGTTVTIYDPAQRWRATPVNGLQGLG